MRAAAGRRRRCAGVERSARASPRARRLCAARRQTKKRLILGVARRPAGCKPCPLSDTTLVFPAGTQQRVVAAALRRNACAPTSAAALGQTPFHSLSAAWLESSHTKHPPHGAAAPGRHRTTNTQPGPWLPVQSCSHLLQVRPRHPRPHTASDGSPTIRSVPHTLHMFADRHCLRVIAAGGKRRLFLPPCVACVGICFCDCPFLTATN